MTASGAGRPLSGFLHHSRSRVPLAAVKATPEKAYRSHTRVSPAFKRVLSDLTASHRLAEKSRWTAASSGSACNIVRWKGLPASPMYGIPIHRYAIHTASLQRKLHGSAPVQHYDSRKRTELLTALQVRIDQRAHGSGAIWKVDVGRLDPLAIEILGQARYLPMRFKARSSRARGKACRVSRQEPSAGPHSRAAGARLPAVTDTDSRHLGRLAGSVQPLEHDEGAALRHVKRNIHDQIHDGLLKARDLGTRPRT